VRLLDPGAGAGALSESFARLCANATKILTVEIDAVEQDILLAQSLEERWKGIAGRRVIQENFVFFALAELEKSAAFRVSYTHALLNPPYVRIARDGDEATALRKHGIHLTNLYAAFISLSLKLLSSGGELVAIVPRSFCNGRQYQSLRTQILRESSIERIHVIDSRRDAFKHDGVIQENVILKLRKGAPQGDIEVSFSKNSTFEDTRKYQRPFAEVVEVSDESSVFRLADKDMPLRLTGARYPLALVSLSVSTGQVVDFRVALHLRSFISSETAPLIHAHHITEGGLEWPTSEPEKMNALVVDPTTKKFLMPRGHYVVVRRFSSKEQPRRVVAAYVNATTAEFRDGVAFENHVNFFHVNRQGLERLLAVGLADFLNSSEVDDFIRAVSGSTQINVSDLKLMKFPGRDELSSRGTTAE